MSVDLVSLLVNYGLAGVVIYIFYTLITNDLRELKNAMSELTREIQLLRESIKKYNNGGR
jgi:hypothetical protein